MPEVEDIAAEPVDSRVAELHFLITPDPWFRGFLHNLHDLFRSKPHSVSYAGAPGVFWHDVFVRRRLPWRRFFESGLYHVFAVVFLWELGQFLVLQPQIVARSPLPHPDVIYYTPSEYLPPLDTRRDPIVAPQKADPEIAKQQIISVPREAENHSQTIVTPPKVRLQHDIALPNTVAWSQKPEMPIVPAPVVAASEISRLAPQLEAAVIKPPPAVRQDRDMAAEKTIHTLQPAVIAPAPEIESDTNRRISDINIGPSRVIAPVPQLAVDEQRAVSSGRSAITRSNAPQVIAPPPTVGRSGASRSGGNLIALSLHPAVGAPPPPEIGNRRGSFAAGPEGRAGASGSPGSSAGSGTGATTAASKKSGDLPSGLYVGKSSNAASTVAGTAETSRASVNPNLIANARPPMVRRNSLESDPKISEAERAVFGGRKIYSLSLNMPNLNSAGGSWIIRFAALKNDDGSRIPASVEGAPSPDNDLSSPVATRKVDPAYPLELMRQNVAGTVILYGIIRSDGSVSSVRVLRSVDDRLDRFASEAIAKWQFQPATRNGAPVDVEATFWIPFRPARTRTDF